MKHKFTTKICLIYLSIILISSTCLSGAKKYSKKLSDRQLLFRVLKEKWVQPVPGTITNPFGNGYHFFSYYRAGHTGIDIKASVGTPVVAVADGMVQYLKIHNNLRYGRYIVIQHKSGLFSLYGHLHQIKVKPKQLVKKGDVIGSIGVSGASGVPHLFPHLHFEILDQIPIRDGAYGYYYICKLPPPPFSDFLPPKQAPAEKKKPKKKEKYRYPFNNFKKSKRPHYTITNKNLKKQSQKYHQFKSPFLNHMNSIRRRYNFLNTYKKSIPYIMRHKYGKCLPVELAPLTYYNPERLLPRYKHSPLYTKPH